VKRRKDLCICLKIQIQGSFATLRMTARKGFSAACEAGLYVARAPKTTARWKQGTGFVAAMSSSPVAGGDTGATPAKLPDSVRRRSTLEPGTVNFCRMSEFRIYR
jgi:hypothetical protein